MLWTTSTLLRRLPFAVLSFVVAVVISENHGMLLHFDYGWISDAVVVISRSTTTTSIGINDAIVQQRVQQAQKQLPADVWDGRLHFLGARLTTSYETFDESVSLTLFGHGIGTGANKAFHLAAANVTGNQLTFQEASEQELFCQYHHLENEKKEPNANNNTDTKLTLIAIAMAICKRWNSSPSNQWIPTQWAFT